MPLFRKKRPADGNPPPVGASARVRLAYYAVFDETDVRNRWLIAGLALSLAVVAIESSSIRFMLPLRQIVPYFLTESRTVPGRVEEADVAASQFTPSQLQVRYAIEEWVTRVWTIDPALTRRNLAQAATLTAGAAAKELPELIRREDVFARMAESPDLRRDVAIQSTDFVGDGVAIVRLALTERENGTPRPPYYKSMVIHHLVVPPKTWEETRRSLVGLTLTDFSWSDARGVDTQH